MNQPASASAAPASGLILALILCLCLVLIGATGYMKHQLNQSEAALANPERMTGTEETVYDRMLTHLGYGGFLTAARQFIDMPDKTSLSRLKDHLSTAKGLFDDRAEQLPPGRRRDVQAILDNYTDFTARAEASLNDPGTPLDAQQMLPLVMSLSTLDTRLQSAFANQRYIAQNQASAWALGLMLVAWVSLVIAAATIVLAYLLINNRQSVLLRALAQSVDNMAKGDLQSPVWGLERKDLIGELARSLNRARQHFATIPDLTIAGEQGPVQIRFEGEAKSLFDAIVRNMAEDFERARREISLLVETGGKQHAMIASVANQLESTTDALKQQGERSDQTLTHVTRSISDSAANLIATQEKTAIQINRMVPFMQERAQKLVEVTSLAGTQVTTTLQSLLQTSLDLKQSLSQSQQNVQKLASDTGAIGERIFAALNLLQVSGKLLSETTEATQSRLNEAVKTLDHGNSGLHQLIERAEGRMQATAKVEHMMAELAQTTNGSAQQLATAVQAIMEREGALRNQLEITAERLSQMTGHFGQAQTTLEGAVQKISGDSNAVGNLVGELRLQNEQLVATLKQNSQTSYGHIQQLAERSNFLLQRLEEQIVHQAKAVETQITALATDGGRLAEQGGAAGTQLGKLADMLLAEQARYEEARQHFQERLASVGQKVEHQASATLAKSESMSAESFAKLAKLSESAEGILQRLAILGQLTSTLGSVAGQLGQLVPALGQSPSTAGKAGQEGAFLANIARDLTQQWQQSLHEIEAMHDSLAQIVVQQKDQLETRLSVIDAKLKTALTSNSDEQQTAIMNEIVLALGKINDHVHQLDETVQELRRG